MKSCCSRRPQIISYNEQRLSKRLFRSRYYTKRNEILEDTYIFDQISYNFLFRSSSERIDVLVTWLTNTKPNPKSEIFNEASFNGISLCGPDKVESYPLKSINRGTVKRWSLKADCSRNFLCNYHGTRNRRSSLDFRKYETECLHYLNSNWGWTTASGEIIQHEGTVHMVMGTFRSRFCVATIMEAKETLARTGFKQSANPSSVFRRARSFDRSIFHAAVDSSRTRVKND